MADWEYPGGGAETDARDSTGRQWKSREIIPAGTILVSGNIQRGNSQNWTTVLPDVFPNGLPLEEAPVHQLHTAGTVAPESVTLAAGTVLASGAKLTQDVAVKRSEEHTSELQSLMRISYAVFCLKKKKQKNQLRDRR